MRQNTQWINPAGAGRCHDVGLQGNGFTSRTTRVMAVGRSGPEVGRFAFEGWP